MTATPALYNVAVLDMDIRNPEEVSGPAGCTELTAMRWG